MELNLCLLKSSTKDKNRITGQRLATKAYRSESENRHNFCYLSNFQSHHPLGLLLLNVNYIQLYK